MRKITRRLHVKVSVAFAANVSTVAICDACGGRSVVAATAASAPAFVPKHCTGRASILYLVNEQQVLWTNTIVLMCTLGGWLSHQLLMYVSGAIYTYFPCNL